MLKKKNAKMQSYTMASNSSPYSWRENVTFSTPWGLENSHISWLFLWGMGVRILKISNNHTFSRCAYYLHRQSGWKFQV